MKFSLFDIMHWPGGTNPTDFDPQRAAEVYDSRMQEYIRAEQLGFDSVFFGEHHFTAYSITPSPNLLIAALSQRTSRIRIGVMINVVPFHDPLRLAEEGAMLDLLTHGRLEFGIGRGVDEQEFLRHNMPYPEARPRFEEGLELILKAWQQPEFEFDGKFRKVGRATIWPRPLQKPHPPIWVTALSPDTIVWAARHGYPMASAFLPPKISKQRFDLYRKTAVEAGHTVGPQHIVQMRNVFVAETDEEARKLAEGPLNHLFRLFIPHAVPKNLDTLPEDYAYYKEFFRPFVGAAMTYEDILNNGILIAGSPKTVTRQLTEQIEETGAGHFLCWMNFGDLSQQQVLRSEELFATQVMPKLRELGQTPKGKAA